MGQVSRPGAVAHREGMILSLALAECDGISTFARQDGFRILRRQDDGVFAIPVDLTRVLEGEVPDPELRPGDIVQVPESVF